MEIVTKEDLEGLRNELLAAIKSINSAPTRELGLLKSQEVKKLFRISETKLYEMRRDGKIPYLKVDGKYLYDYNELLNAFKQAAS